MAPAVAFSGVSKRFRLGETHDSLRDALASLLGRVRRRKPAGETQAFWALRDIDFDVAQGDTLGIIGPNGAGKSTALKLLAGILRPDEGVVSVRGRLAGLIEVGAGFHGDLTGRENVFLNGAILGMTRAEVRQKLDAIVAFAGLEQFLDTPVKRYSSGMYARLGFSIAAHVEPEILLVDEVLSVGDAAFRLRCLERMRILVAAGTTLVFVTHDLDQMQSTCRRAIVLAQGRVCYAGPANEAVGHYLRAMSQLIAERPADISCGQGEVRVRGLRWLDAYESEVVIATAQAPLAAEVILEAERPIEEVIVEVNMRSGTNEAMLSFNSGRSGVRLELIPGANRMMLALPALPLAGGEYFWNVRAWDAKRGEILFDTPFQYPLVVHDAGRATGALCLEHAWRSESPHACPERVPAEAAR